MARLDAATFVLVTACAGEPMGEVDETDGASGTSTTGEATSSSSTGSTTSAGSSSSEESSSSSGESSDSEASSGGPAASLPSEVLDLANWKLTLPIAGRREGPREVLQPELATFAIDPWFMVDASGHAVVFRANAGGVTTDNSGYPRSELREMASEGAEEAAWSTGEGTHTMTIVQSITNLPVAKPHVVAGQIHDAEDDVVMIRLEGEHLFVEGGGDELGALEPAYALGTVFTVVLAAHDGMIDVYYENLDTPAVSIERDVDGCYFKAGAYTQSNEEQGDEPDAYGEVVIRELVVVHE